MKRTDIESSDFSMQVEKIVESKEAFSLVISRGFRKSSAVIRIIAGFASGKKPGLRFMFDGLFVGGDILGPLAVVFGHGYSATVEELSDEYLVHFLPSNYKSDNS